MFNTVAADPRIAHEDPTSNDPLNRNMFRGRYKRFERLGPRHARTYQHGNVVKVSSTVYLHHKGLSLKG